MSGVSVELRDAVALVTLDDGKANAAGHALIEGIGAALDRAAAEARAVAIVGRPGVLSGGFDLKVIRSGDATAISNMVNAGARLMMRLWGHPQPVVIGATGHAVALGAFMLLTGDFRLASSGEFRIGLNETAIGMTLPGFGLTLAEARLSRRHLVNATLNATLFDPDGARDVGFVDAVVEPGELVDATVARAAQLASYDAAAFAGTKAAQRGAHIQRVLEGLPA